MRARSMSRWALLVALGCATIPRIAQADAPYSGAIQRKLQSIEEALKGKDWQGALEGADGLLANMALGDYRGAGSRTAYGLAFAFRALAAEELGREHEADWDWGCARALAENVVGFDFSPLGGAQQRIRERETSRASAPPKWEEIKEGHEGKVTPPEKVKVTQPAYPTDDTWGRREVKISYSATIGLDGLLRDPRPESEEELSNETSFFVMMFLVVRDWEFRPAQLDGAPIETQYNLTTEWKRR